jgi:ATP-dependent DNA ligase
MPALVDKPPKGAGWIHEVKFDGYRSQIFIDSGGVRIFTRRGLDWTSKYRDLAATAKTLDVESAIIDGEIIVLNDKGLSDFAELQRRSRGASAIFISSPST